MHDQADTLRQLMKERKGFDAHPHEHQKIDTKRLPQVITFTSGKKKVGNTFLSNYLAALFSQSDLRVLCFDNKDLNHSQFQADYRLYDCDIVLIDRGANPLSSLYSPYHNNVIVLTPESVALADAYGMIKRLKEETGLFRFQVIVNRADEYLGLKSFERLKNVTLQFIDVHLDYIGHCENDENINQSVMKKNFLLESDLGARSLSSLQTIAYRLREARFTDEPARVAPGNGAKSLYTLLGGVNA